MITQEDINREKRIEIWCKALFSAKTPQLRAEANKGLIYEINHRSKAQIQKMEQDLGLNNVR